MDFLAAFFALIVLYAVALIMAAYVDHRARRRIQSGELPPRMPWLVFWGIGGGISFLYLFSPLFPRLQDRTTRCLIWPLRLIVGGSTLVVMAAIVGLGIQIWLDSAVP